MSARNARNALEYAFFSNHATWSRKRSLVRNTRDIFLIVMGLVSMISTMARAEEGVPPEGPLYAFCGTGDHLWVAEREPVDSPATIEAMFEWMARTYKISRMYWRGGQSCMWHRPDSLYRRGKASVPQYDWFAWLEHLDDDLKINEAAVAAARRHGMEIFLYTGLFEHGVQPDIGIIAPYLIEDSLRVEHPEWCPLDRWGQRRCPGPLEFGYPEVRQKLVARYMEQVTRFGYDGINFYTYVENYGLRYPDEFGFNAPVEQEFRRKYPGVDLRRDVLTREQKEHWYRCRGKFVTEFLRELHDALAGRGKKLSVILDARNPDYAQPWWGLPLPGTGMIHMDWPGWVERGIVDELWVQLGPVAEQRATLDKLLAHCQGKPVRLTVRTVNPFDPGWARYRAAGVTPVAVTTVPKNGIERLALEPTSPASLNSPDWRMRAQTLVDIASGKLTADATAMAALARDKHALVRRKAVQALAASRTSEPAVVLEKALSDPESSVRIAAASALSHAHGPTSAAALLAALERDGYFQFKMACVEALAATASLSQLQAASTSPHLAVREAAVRALGSLGRGDQIQAVHPLLRTIALNAAEDYRVRYYALDGLVAMRQGLSAGQRRETALDCIGLLAGPADREEAVTVQLKAANALGWLAGSLDPACREQALSALVEFFRGYGDGCARVDAAYGWRVAGNAILGFGPPGRAHLEALRGQRRDKWLAWLAYEVVYLEQKPHAGKFCLVDEQETLTQHEQFAPAFPGWRRW